MRLPLDSMVLADGASETLVATTVGAPPERIRALCETGAEVLMESFSRPISFSTDKLRTATGAWFPAPCQVELRREVLPEPGPDDVRVRAIASAISHGTEMLVYRGQVPSALGLDLPTLKGGFDFPIKYGYASVGRVVEAGGTGDALQAAIECAAFQGTVVVGSWYGTKPVTLCLGQSFHRGRVRVVSSQVSSIDPALQPRWNRARRLSTVVSLLPILELSPLITHRIPFGSAAEAYNLVDRRPDETIQVILVYEDNDV